MITSCDIRSSRLSVRPDVPPYVLYTLSVPQNGFIICSLVLFSDRFPKTSKTLVIKSPPRAHRWQHKPVKNGEGNRGGKP